MADQSDNDDRTPTRPGRVDYERALDSMGTFIDISATDLMELARRAERFAAQRDAQVLRVDAVMSSPVHGVAPGATMAQAAEVMVTQRISGLPVVDDTGVLVGIITEADFLRALGIPAQDPALSLWQTLESLFHHLGRHGQMPAPDDRVREHMQTQVVTVATSDDVFEALARMKTHRIKRLVVCDTRRHAVGMLTRSDLVRIFFGRFSPPHAGPA
ncbi:MAG: CBS domain-containing protein [Chromatiaceae bacterium]|nr:CBS domain-containing protein [Gammaproteobacteria bacterium]MCP5300661.1 CBS domain-containing protein [Chromatiaceae bacterium]MCP5422733.1 CBS domain-containing protein [Chromatiaceae bacterium]